MRTNPFALFVIAAASFATLSPTATSFAQDAAAEQIVVTGEEIPSAYGAPPGISRTRFSPLTTAYVLPPWAFYFGTVYEGKSWREGFPLHSLTQEIEMGLPYRFGIAMESSFERFDGGGGPAAASIELRYALADWNKIPLNPTLFAEYKFGTGAIRREGFREEEGGEEEEEEGGDKTGTRPDAFEFRLLLAQDFREHFEWAMNWFFEQEAEQDEGREWGFAQSVVTPVLLPNERLKVGIEMMYTNFTNKMTRDDPENSFVIGPTVAWKPSKNTRIDVSPLFGATEESPAVQVFAVFSWVFGGGPEGTEAEAPVSTRNR